MNYNTLLIDINEPSELTVELYDISGRLVRSVWSGEASIGNHKIEHNVEDLASGLYVYRINTGKTSYAKRFVKQWYNQAG